MFLANISVQFILPRELERWHLQDHEATSNLMLCETILITSKRYSSHTAGIPLVFPKAENSFGCTCMLTLTDSMSWGKLEISACPYLSFHHSYHWVTMHQCQQCRNSLLKYLMQSRIRRVSKLFELFVVKTDVRKRLQELLFPPWSICQVFPYQTITPSLLLLTNLVSSENKREFFHLFY